MARARVYETIREAGPTSTGFSRWRKADRFGLP